MTIRNDSETFSPPVALGRRQAAGYLGIGQTLLWELTSAGAIPSVRLGRRRLWRRADLERWLAERPVAATVDAEGPGR